MKIFKSKILKRILFFITLLPVALLFVFPLVWMILTSFKPEAEIFSDISSLRAFLPSKAPLSEWFNNYKELQIRFDITNYLFNSIKYSTVAMFLSCLLNSLAGYALARLKVPFRHVLLAFIIGTMVIPVETTMIPLYLIVRGFKGVNNIGGYIIPFIVNGMYIFLFRQFFLSIPKELEEAARIDGAGTIRTYFFIILPNCKAIFATIAIFSFIAVWNDFLWAVMIFSDASKQTVQVGLQGFMAIKPVYTGHVMAALTLITLPMIIVYSIFQKYIVEGMTHTAVKG